VLFFTSVDEVKKSGRSAKISSKHQVTIPLDAMRRAGLAAGDRVVVRAEGSGRVVFEREADVLAEAAGLLTGVYPSDALESLRREWD
jgi:bifunctional DNA-binding transcriptional regulator/antitoxin component of YhaV-PrlF toxin-antitoxin module